MAFMWGWQDAQRDFRFVDLEAAILDFRGALSFNRVHINTGDYEVKV